VTTARGWAAKSLSAQVRLRAQRDRLRQEIALLREEIRIKDLRMSRIPPHRRPHYTPVERMAILELRAARGWTASRTADRFLVTPATIASWMQRLDEEGPDALLQLREPVNKFPDFVAYIVRRLKVLCPSMGKERIAQVLCRVGLHLGSTTVGRMLRERPKPLPAVALPVLRRVCAKQPNHVWNVDLTTVPTSAGLWTSWLPWAMPQRRPFCWWVAVIVDHFSRRVMGLAVFETQPSSRAVRTFLHRTIFRAGASPKYLITDQGTQFTDKRFRRWCRRKGIGQRFGAVGKYGSLAVVERLIRTLKQECTRRILVPLDRRPFEREIGLFVAWYNGHRPHSFLEASTPNEVYFSRTPASRRARFEPRCRWPRRSPCAGPQAPVRGRRGVRLDLRVAFRAGRKHLPIVSLRRAA
jgi:transposase InsO family protein